MTVIADVPRFPSLVAVIVANPAVRPVTRPLPLTVAMPASLLVLYATGSKALDARSPIAFVRLRDLPPIRACT